jgi:hypothetical protein
MLVIRPELTRPDVWLVRSGNALFWECAVMGMRCYGNALWFLWAHRRQCGRDARCSGSRLDANAVIDGRPNALLAAEVPLCRLNRDVPEQELNLLQLATRRMA